MGNSTEQLAPEPRSCRLGTRFSSTELALVEKVATWRGLPPSAFVRGAALAAAKRAEGRGPDIEDVVPSASSFLTSEQVTAINAVRIEVKRVGVNLNELGRLSRRGVLDLGALAGVVDELAEQNQRLLEALGGKGHA